MQPTSSHVLKHPHAQALSELSKPPLGAAAVGALRLAHGRAVRSPLDMGLSHWAGAALESIQVSPEDLTIMISMCTAGHKQASGVAFRLLWHIETFQTRAVAHLPNVFHLLQAEHAAAQLRTLAAGDEGHAGGAAGAGRSSGGGSAEEPTWRRMEQGALCIVSGWLCTRCMVHH